MTAVDSTRIRGLRRKIQTSEAAAKLQSVPPAQWLAWMAERWSMTRVAAATGVSRSAISGFVKSKGWAWPKCALGRPIQSGRGRDGKSGPKTQPRVAVGNAWTWFDYMKQTDLEFATPHHLRKAPAMREWLIANGVRS